VFTLFVIGAITDFLDGYLARKYNVVSNIGKFLDPIADKVLLLSGLIVIVYVQFSFDKVFDSPLLYLTLISIFIIIARDYIVDVIRQIASTKGKVIPADIYGKLKTFVQDFAVPMLLFYFALIINGNCEVAGFVKVFGLISYALFAIGVILTILSGVNYFVKNKDILLK
jgi:CDP-diacylglycerol---glycerol-3-phosphate 3-phosphatidyltransferase